MVNTLIPANILNINSFLIYPTDIFASPCVIDTIIQIPNWSGLAGIKQQGCGLNVLSLYGLIEENKAREMVVCLDMKGTSIYKIVDYINNYADRIGSINVGYMICRLPFLYGINWLYFFIQQQHSIKGGYIFKMYKDFYQKNTNKFSQIGHTVSFFKDTSGNIFFVDPQQSINILLGDYGININNLSSNTFLRDFFVQNNYNFNYIDIIFTLKENPHDFGNRLIFSKQDLLQNTLDLFGGTRPGQQEFINRDVTINYGGYKKKTRKIKKAKKCKKNQKTKSKKNKNVKKSIKNYKGGSNELDNFEKMMIEIDQKNGIESAIVIPQSECK